jgi:hypothetical protein
MKSEAKIIGKGKIEKIGKCILAYLYLSGKDVLNDENVIYEAKKTTKKCKSELIEKEIGNPTIILHDGSNSTNISIADLSAINILHNSELDPIYDQNDGLIIALIVNDALAVYLYAVIENDIPVKYFICPNTAIDYFEEYKKWYNKNKDKLENE